MLVASPTLALAILKLVAVLSIPHQSCGLRPARCCKILVSGQWQSQRLVTSASPWLCRSPKIFESCQRQQILTEGNVRAA